MVAGDQRGIGAIDLQLVAFTEDSIAGGQLSVLVGGFSNAALGNQSVVVGGGMNRAEEAISKQNET